MIWADLKKFLAWGIPLLALLFIGWLVYDYQRPKLGLGVSQK